MDLSENMQGAFISEEIKDFLFSVTINLCNCYNSLGHFDYTIKIISDIIPHKSFESYYLLISKSGRSEAEKDYNKLSTLILSEDPALKNLKSLIGTARNK